MPSADPPPPPAARPPLPFPLMPYLDNNATTRPAPEVCEAVVEMLHECWHNPSSMHRPGQAARHRIELARRAVADLIGARPRDIVFTSGATESINLAIRGVLSACPPDRRVLITSPIEHEAVRDLCSALEDEPGFDGFAVRQLPVSSTGAVDASALPELLDDHVGLVSIQWANNETGVIQPVGPMSLLCNERRIPFHCDAAQWIGKKPTDLGSSDPALGSAIDLLSCSAHKMHGPKGVGALFIRRGTRLRPQIRGVQERERRGGTENAPGIVGMGVAASLASEWLGDDANRTRVATLRDHFESGVLRRLPDARINGAPVDPSTSAPNRLWNTTNIAFPGLEAEALLLQFSERGLCASAGAACSSGSLDPSPVLKAMHISDALAHGSIRFSLSRETTETDITSAIEIVVSAVERVRRSSQSLL